MSVLEENVLDGMFTTDDGDGIVLFISDHLEWEKEAEHLIKLQAKINSYLAFLESKQYKEHTDKDIKYGIIYIAFMYEPTEKAYQFLRVVQNQVEDFGVVIQYEVSGADDDEEDPDQSDSGYPSPT